MIVTTRKSDNSRVVLLATLHKSSDPNDPAPYNIYPVAELLPIDHETEAFHDPATLDTPDTPDEKEEPKS